ARVRILGIQVARPVGPVGVQHVVAVEVGAGDLAHRPEASREVPVLTQRRHPGRAETEPRPGFRPPKHAPRRSAAGPAVHQRPYQRRPPPVDAPPTKKPISHSRTAKISTYHSTCAANPSPPNTASNSSSTMNATISSSCLGSPHIPAGIGDNHASPGQARALRLRARPRFGPGRFGPGRFRAGPPGGRP